MPENNRQIYYVVESTLKVRVGSSYDNFRIENEQGIPMCNLGQSQISNCGAVKSNQPRTLISLCHFKKKTVNPRFCK